jgi:hypothetical protein
MHGPLNVKSVSCLVTFGRNILLGEEEKGNEQLLFVRKKYFILCWMNFLALKIIPCMLVFCTQYVSSLIFELEISVERLLYGFTIKLVVLGFWILFIILCSKNIRKPSQLFGSCIYIPLSGSAAYVFLFYPTMEIGPVSKDFFLFSPTLATMRWLQSGN